MVDKTSTIHKAKNWTTRTSYSWGVNKNILLMGVNKNILFMGVKNILLMEVNKNILLMGVNKNILLMGVSSSWCSSTRRVAMNHKRG